MDWPVFDHARALHKGREAKHALSGSAFVADLHVQANIDLGQLHLGSPEDYRSAVADLVGCDPDGVHATCGTTGANTAACLALLSPGDHVVIERPTYQPLAAAAHALGCQITHVDRDPDAGWRLNPDHVNEACTNDTSLIILSSPNNPTGAMTTAQDLEALHQIAMAVDAHVLVDQVYAPLQDAPWAAGGRLIATSGFNKTFGAPALRTGFVAADPEVAERISRVHEMTHMAAPPWGMTMAMTLMANEDRHRDALHQRLQANHAIYHDWCKATGIDDQAVGLTAFPNMGTDTAVLAREALEAGILILAGEHFGIRGHIRVGLGGDSAALSNGLAALGQLLVQA